VNAVKKIIFDLTAILALLTIAHASSTTTLLAPFVGIWSNSQDGCKKLKQGILDEMITVEASQFGIVEITTAGIDSLYSSGSMSRCSFAQGKTRKSGEKIIAPAFCVDDDRNSEPTVNLIFSPISSTKIQMQYGAVGEDFKSDYYIKVLCRW
jgi:hypothetical protein